MLSTHTTWQHVIYCMQLKSKNKTTLDCAVWVLRLNNKMENNQSLRELREDESARVEEGGVVFSQSSGD